MAAFLQRFFGGSGTPAAPATAAAVGGGDSESDADDDYPSDENIVARLPHVDVYVTAAAAEAESKPIRRLTDASLILHKQENDNVVMSVFDAAFKRHQWVAIAPLFQFSSDDKSAIQWWNPAAGQTISVRVRDAQTQTKDMRKFTMTLAVTLLHVIWDHQKQQQQQDDDDSSSDDGDDDTDGGVRANAGRLHRMLYTTTDVREAARLLDKIEASVVANDTAIAPVDISLLNVNACIASEARALHHRLKFEGKPSLKGAEAWNEFRKAYAGRGFSMKQLAKMYRKENSK